MWYFGGMGVSLASRGSVMLGRWSIVLWHGSSGAYYQRLSGRTVHDRHNYTYGREGEMSSEMARGWWEGGNVGRRRAMWVSSVAGGCLQDTRCVQY